MIKEDDLRQLYREFDAKCAQQADRLASRRQYEHELFIPTLRAKDEQQRVFDNLLKEAQELLLKRPVHKLVKNHFVEFLKGQLLSLEILYERPARSIDQLTWSIDFMIRKDSRTAEERFVIIEDRLNQVDELWDSIVERLTGADPAHLNELRESCLTLGRVLEILIQNLPQYCCGLTSSELKRLGASFRQLSAKGSQWAEIAAQVLASQSCAEKPLNDDSSVIKLDEAYYENLLRESLGVELQELVAWHDDEVSKTREELFEIAARLGARHGSIKEVVNLLNTHAGPCATPEEMFVRGRDYLARAKAGCKGYVRLPEEKCRVVKVPEQVRTHYPWGGYSGGCPQRRPMVGEMFLNETNYRAVTDGWLKMMAVHEAYPGHHVQFVRTTLDPLPETVKLGARSVPLIEGTAHRSERVFEFVFEEDPYYPLFVAYRRHHTAVRIKAELYLRYYGRPIADAVQLYMDELSFDRSTARGQVKAQELMVGYFNCYYYGLKKLLDLEKQYGYNEKEFTELLFSVGRISLASFEAFLQLPKEDQELFLKGFESAMR